MEVEKILKEVEKNQEIFPKKKANISDHKIKKIKEELTNIDSSMLITEAMKSTKKKYLSESKLIKKNDKSIEILNRIKNNAITKFINDLNIKNQKQIKDIFIEELDKFKVDAELAINRKEIILSQYISKYNQIYEENKLLKQNVIETNKKFSSIENEIKDYQDKFVEMKIQFDFFDKNKKLFDEFKKRFPEDDPIEIMNEYERRYLESINLIKENNELKIQMQKLTQKNISDNEEKQKYINKLYDKIDKLKKEKNKIIEKFESRISKLNHEIKQIQSLEEKNKLLHKILYQIYNKLFESFRLNKNIEINEEELDIKEEDFNPNIFDDAEFGKYIKLMIITTMPTKCDKLLRETIGYSNMILRKYLKNKLNLRFDPRSTFIELKIILEEKEDKINKLSDLSKSLESKLNNKENENKKLINIIKHFRNDQINKINKKHMQNINEISNGNKFKRRNMNVKIKNYKSNSNSFYSKYFSEENKSLEEGQKLIHSYNKSNSERKTTELYTIKKSKINIDSYDIFNNHKIRPKSSISPNLIKNKKNRFYSPKNNINKIKNRMLSPKSRKSSKNTENINNDNIESYFYKDPKYQSLYIMNKNLLKLEKSKSNSNINSKKDKFNIFKKIKFENKGKIIKEHGNQSLITYLNEFKQFVNHTNRLFFYKSRITSKSPSSLSFNIKNKKKVISRVDNNNLESKLKTRIIGKINSLINIMETKKADESNDKDEDGNTININDDK